MRLNWSELPESDFLSSWEIMFFGEITWILLDARGTSATVFDDLLRIG